MAPFGFKNALRAQLGPGPGAVDSRALKPVMVELDRHPYARFLARVAKPNRYTGVEHGSVHKDWGSVQARVCLAFPDIYDIGMSHLGFRILYRLLNDDERTLAERCYAPWIDMQAQLREHGQLLVSLESARPLCDFDVVGFSLQYELTYTNILSMLDLGGIPLKSEHRSDDDPLIVAGGPVATHMEPMAMFLDAVLIGDGEEAASEIALKWTQGKREGLSRRERLEQLAEIGGVYVPSLYAVKEDAETGFEVVDRPLHPNARLPVERRLVADINQFPFPSSGPVGGPEAIFDRMSIEVARGCTEGCRFCQAGMIYRPVRERDPRAVVETVVEALERTGQDEVSLTALSTADVSCISPLIKTLVEKTAPRRVSLSVASLRAYGLAEELLDDMRKVRAGGLTFAPEAGTQRMRDVINKNVTEAQLLETAERVFSRGFDRMKLYFILGLPTETDEDVLGIVLVGKNALGVGRKLGKRPKVTVSVSTHVPKPHTPFQWCAMDPPEDVARKQALLREAARAVRGLSLKVHDSATSYLEGVFARGDRKLGHVIERAYLNGARFDSWEDQLAMDVWREAFRYYSVDTERYLETLPLTARLPWDHIDVGLEDGFLEREYRKALQSRLSPPCGKAKGAFVHHASVSEAENDRRRLVCYDCGVACDMTRMRARRVDYLRDMGALEPSQRVVLPVVAAPPTEAPAPSDPSAPDPSAPDPSAPDPSAPEIPRVLRGPERHRPPQPAGKVVRYRLRYAKLGAAALLGHLDLIRELGRVIRRAGMQVYYTQGFHPKPSMSFGPALSLGVMSVDEYVDVKLVGPPDAKVLVERLNLAVAGGLRFLGAAAVAEGAPAIGRVIVGARYLVSVADSVVREHGGAEWFDAKVAQFLASDSVRVIRTTKGLGRPVDVRAAVTGLTRVTHEHPAFEAAGIVGECHALEFDLAISERGGAKMTEVMAGIFGVDDLPHLALRWRFLTSMGDATPLELCARPVPPPVRQNVEAAPMP
ncbi:MAG TPA: TIGR03960 family B12-binding radical SAM protein [Polyangiaceae bacterium]|nr:TIGR03960 family B12-binding radical SAM protein [Polyangiaceae bacterium]